MGFYPFAPLVPSGALLATALAGQTIPGNLTLTNLFATQLSGSGVSFLNGGTNTASSAPLLTPTNANGTAAQLTDTTRNYFLYLSVGTAGTALSVAIGPTSGVADTIYTASTATAGQTVSFLLPAGWFWKWSATTATLAEQTAIGC